MSLVVDTLAAMDTPTPCDFTARPGSAATPAATAPPAASADAPAGLPVRSLPAVGACAVALSASPRRLRELAETARGAAGAPHPAAVVGFAADAPVLSRLCGSAGVVWAAVGFPSGRLHPLLKAAEARAAVDDGAAGVVVTLAPEEDPNRAVTDIVAVREAVSAQVPLVALWPYKEGLPEPVAQAARKASAAAVITAADLLG